MNSNNRIAAILYNNNNNNNNRNVKTRVIPVIIGATGTISIVVLKIPEQHSRKT